MKVYDILLAATEINEYSIPLNRAYAIECLELGIEKFAFDVVEKMKDVMNMEEHIKFSNEIDSLAEIKSNIAWESN